MHCMHYNLFFNGCSFTEGYELEGETKDFEYRRLNRFSHIIHERTGKTYDNIALSGASNDRIARTTIEWFESGNTCDLAIIQLTFLARLEYMVPLQNRKLDINPGLLESGMLKDDIFTTQSIKFYYKDVYNNNYGFYNFYKNLFILEQYFQKNNIKHYFMKIRHLKEVTDDHIIFWKNVCCNRYTDIVSICGNILSKNNDTKDYCQYIKKSSTLYLTGTHPSEIGHQKIAEHIIKHAL